MTYSSRMSHRRALASITGVWICSLAISFVPIYSGWFSDGSAATATPLQEPTSNDDCSGLRGVNRIYAVVTSTTSFYPSQNNSVT